VAGATLEAEVSIPAMEQVHDLLGRPSALSVQITWGPACGTVLRYSIRAVLSSSLIGIIRPDFPLLAESRRQMARPIEKNPKDTPKKGDARARSPSPQLVIEDQFYNRSVDLRYPVNGC
jgi:hypothetical protein